MVKVASVNWLNGRGSISTRSQLLSRRSVNSILGMQKSIEMVDGTIDENKEYDSDNSGKTDGKDKKTNETDDENNQSSIFSCFCCC